MEKEKKPEFVVTDRRKFTVDGEPRAEAASETPAPAPGPAATAKPAAPPQEKAAPPPEKPVPPKQEKPAANPAASSSSGPDLATGYSAERERASFGGQKMEFVHLLDMLVQTAMMYSGAMDTGTERRVDIVGLRQMIDLIAVLEEKTQGNLTEQEENILKNTLFQLRMTYMEIVNMIDRQAMQKAPGAPGPARK
jgi:Domain of unknown function (DUF1844)